MKTVTRSLYYFFLYTLILGVFYPAVITLLGQFLFFEQANGSMISKDGKIVGSKFVGQEFKENKYFWSRPSSTSPTPYNALSSSGSNQSLSNPSFQRAVKDREEVLNEISGAIPIDLVTSSGSGLDPEISMAAARFQASRVAKARGLSLSEVEHVIDENKNGRLFGIFGEPRVNVLTINLALDSL